MPKIDDAVARDLRDGMSILALGSVAYTILR